MFNSNKYVEVSRSKQKQNKKGKNIWGEITHFNEILKNTKINGEIFHVQRQEDSVL